jgi:hypothetical protein
VPGRADSPAEAVAAYRLAAASKTVWERQEGRVKTGVVIGAVATNPATSASILVFVADYVLPASSEQHRRCRHNLALVLGCFMKWLVWPWLAAGPLPSGSIRRPSPPAP